LAWGPEEYVYASSANLPRPKIIVIMTDDVGFSDLGCYGGEIQTPYLDALAHGGIRFSQFYNTPAAARRGLRY
jgi:arylsulfatase